MDDPDLTLAERFAAGALRIRIECACGRASELPERIVCARFGPGATFAQIAAKARCSVCRKPPCAISQTAPEPIAASRPVLSHLVAGGAPQPRPLIKRRRRAGRQNDASWGER